MCFSFDDYSALRSAMIKIKPIFYAYWYQVFNGTFTLILAVIILEISSKNQTPVKTAIYHRHKGCVKKNSLFSFYDCSTLRQATKNLKPLFYAYGCQLSNGTFSLILALIVCEISSKNQTQVKSAIYQTQWFLKTSRFYGNHLIFTLTIQWMDCLTLFSS